ncbi:MAG: toll/interleukin-1 receptor domain-containing protein [Lachnospiraceae bacterium]|nr:toll/interleukin-1 receptor domain-containing protein [Lachnospiraceae bacterium]
MHIFISHSSADAKTAQEICTLIEQNNATCFIAPRNIRSGKEYAEEIMNGIEQSDAMVVVMSENANHSPHVLREVERAVSRSIPILVYKLEEVKLTKSMEYFLMTHQWITSKEKRDYSEILAFIKEHDAENKATMINTVKPVTSHKKKFIFPVIILAAVLLVMIIGISFVGNKTKHQYTVGDTITFGRYNGEEINWRILKISENGEEAILIAEDILTMKAYDVAEGGRFNCDGYNEYWSLDSEAETDYSLQIKVRGNNTWEESNIRTWLNSSDEVVIYTDQAPIALATSEHFNGYQNEAGFLHYFTEEEQEAILLTEITTNANVLSEDTTTITHDKIFLLSKEELQWFEDAGMSLFATPTAAALEQDNSNWYDIQLDAYNIQEYYWWLREPVEGTSSKCYMVNNGYTQEQLTTANVGTEGFGIRPAVTVDLTSDIFKK